MTERPNVILGLLLTTTTLAALALAAGLMFLGAAGAAELVAMVIGSFSACIYFLAELRQIPLTAVLPVVLLVVSAGAFVRAAFAYLRQRMILKRLPLELLAGDLADVARTAGTAALYRTPASRPAAFCFGLRNPRLVVTQGLLERLDADEQEAAVWHEAEHARAHEPVKCLVARLAAQTFFWMPILSDLLERYLLAKELDADRNAVAMTSRRALAGALCEVVGTPTPAGAVGLSDHAATRVDRLFDPRAPLPPLTRPLRLAASATAALAIILAALFPAQLQAEQTTHLRSMLTNMGLHGLPGMAAGFTVNSMLLIGMALSARWLLRSRG